ncbi:MAG: BrnA antitoxin family protein [Bacteroidales bacterium]|nr:BrnA antitoxin family protein [Bacteroidales bacterium]
MRKEYDFSKMKGRKNPYAKVLKKQVTIRMGVDIIEYFKSMSEETGIPYQNLINLYLRDCVQSQRKLSMKWLSKKAA